MNIKYAALLSLPFTVLPAGTAHASERATAVACRPVVSDVPGAGRLLDLVNRERTTAGLVPLAPRDDVAAIAGPWTRRMAADGRLGHNTEYLRPSTMDRIDAEIIGENVAAATSLDEAHHALMASPRHRENIMNPDFRQVGIAVVRTTTNTLYLTEDFMKPRSGSYGNRARPAQCAVRRPSRRSTRRTSTRLTQSATRR
jgi:hypothetical protein